MSMRSVRRSARPLLTTVFLTFSICVAAAEAPDLKPWFGTWKLDRANSHLIGPAITIDRTSRGYHFDFGAVAFDVGDDGKDYVTVPPRTTSIRQTGPSAWFRVHKTGGKEVDHSTLVIDASNALMTIDTVATGPDGLAHASHEVLKRIAPGEGLAGTWRSGSEGVNVTATLELSDGGDGKLHWNMPDDRQSFDALPDGPPVQLTGAGSIPGLTMVLRQSQAGLSWTNYLDTKPWMVGTDTLSVDGMQLTETTWTPARPMDRQVAVYHRSSGANPVKPGAR